jgi:hypothetical protein
MQFLPINIAYRIDKDNEVAGDHTPGHSGDRAVASTTRRYDMSEHCRCGDVIQHVYESWTCSRCRRDCCPSCAERDGERAMCVGCQDTDASGAAA